MNITAFIVDDEQQSRETLKDMLQEFCPDVAIIGTAATIDEAVSLIRNGKPDVLFLDINLGESTGFELLNRLHKYDCDVIFVTAYDNYALKAFRYEATDYLLKPINYKLLIENIEKIKKKKAAPQQLQANANSANNVTAQSARIALSDVNKTDFIIVNDIIYLESNGTYTSFYLRDGTKYVKAKNLKYFEDILHDYKQFIRVHKSYIVNKEYIKSYKRNTSELQCENKITIPTTLGYKVLLELMNSLQ